MNNPRLLFDCHLDISMNAMEFNRDQRWSLENIRRCELTTSFIPPDMERHRSRNTVCFPELRRGRFGIIVATQIARYSPRFHNLPGWRSPEQAWAQTQGQLSYYRAMEECGEMVQLRTWAEVEAHAARWTNATDDEATELPIGYLLSLEGADSILSWRHLERSRADGLDRPRSGASRDREFTAWGPMPKGRSRRRDGSCSRRWSGSGSFSTSLTYATKAFGMRWRTTTVHSGPVITIAGLSRIGIANSPTIKSRCSSNVARSSAWLSMPS